MNRLQSLIEKYRSQSCSSAELSELLSYLTEEFHESALKTEIKNQLSQSVNEKEIESEETDMVLERIHSKMGNDILKKRSHKMYWGLAGAAVLIFGIFGMLQFNNEKFQTKNIDHTAKIPNPVILPAGNHAVLTLADGKTISLQDASKGKLLEADGISVNKTGEGEINFASQKNIKVAESKPNVLNIPNGGTYRITLADGTLVWLNSGSTLTFPSFFAGKERSVELKGEAYFEVAHNGKPFKVVTATQTVQVLGTHFNVSAYTDEHEVKTTLLEGSVEVTKGQQSVLLKPGKMSVSKGASALRVIDANIEEVLDWKNGLFIIDDNSIAEVMQKASRWYNVEVEIKGDIGQKKLLGTVSRYKTINELLDVIAMAGKISYKIEGRRVTLMK